MKLQAVISSISAEGSKLVVLLRLSPLFPFSILNYALGKGFLFSNSPDFLALCQDCAVSWSMAMLLQLQD